MNPKNPKVVHIGRKGPKVWASKGWKVLDAQPFGEHWIVTLEKQKETQKGTHEHNGARSLPKPSLGLDLTTV